MLPGGRELGEGVHRRAVAGDGEHAPVDPGASLVGQAHRAAERGREPVAEPPGALRRVELAVLRVPAVPRPVGGDGHVPVRLHGRRDGGADVRQEPALHAEVLGVEAGGDARVDVGDHLGRGAAVPDGGVLRHRARLAQRRGEGLERLAGVGAHTQRGVVGLQHARLRVHLDEAAARLEREVVRGDLAERGAHHEQHLRVLEQVRDEAVLHPAAEAERVLPREGGVAARRADHGRLEQLRDLPQALHRGPAGAAHTAAGHDRHPPGPAQPAHGLGHELGARRVVVGHGQGVLDRGHHDLAEQHVLRDLDPHRPLRHGDGLGPRVLDGGRDARGVVHRELGLGDVAGRGLLVVQLVQHALAPGTEPGQRDLRGDHEHRHTRGVRLLQAGQRGERARAGGQEQDADLAGGPGVPVRGEGGVVLHAVRDELQRGAGQGVEEAEGVLARDAEDRPRAQGVERLHGQVAAVAPRGRRRRLLVGHRPGSSPAAARVARRSAIREMRS